LVLPLQVVGALNPKVTVFTGAHMPRRTM